MWFVRVRVELWFIALLAVMRSTSRAKSGIAYGGTEKRNTNANAVLLRFLKLSKSSTGCGISREWVTNILHVCDTIPSMREATPLPVKKT